MLAQCPFSPIVSWLYNRMDDKYEPVLKAVVYFFDKISHFLTDV